MLCGALRELEIREAIDEYGCFKAMVASGIILGIHIRPVNELSAVAPNPVIAGCVRIEDEFWTYRPVRIGLVHGPTLDEDVARTALDVIQVVIGHFI